MAEVYSEVRELSRKLCFLTNKMASLEHLFLLPALFSPSFPIFQDTNRNICLQVTIHQEPWVLVSVHCDFWHPPQSLWLISLPLNKSGELELLQLWNYEILQILFLNRFFFRLKLFTKIWITVFSRSYVSQQYLLIC